MDAVPGRKRGRRAAAALLGVLAALGIFEAVLRISTDAPGAVPADADLLRASGPLMASEDPELVYVRRPGGSLRNGGGRAESHGVLRDTEISEAPAPGVVRVVVVGDSIGAAVGLPYGQRFPDRLELALRASGATAEVLNLCVDGYDTLQEARTLETSAQRFQPDLVLVQCCLNDTMLSPMPLHLFRPPARPASLAFEFLAAGTARLTGRPRGREWMPVLGPTGPAADVWRRAYDPRSDGWRAAEAGLDRIAQWTAARRVPVLFAIVPLLLPDDAEGRSTQTFRRAWTDAARARSLETIDLQAPLATYPVASLRWAPDDVYHFGSEGHAALADALAAHVRLALPR